MSSERGLDRYDESYEYNKHIAPYFMKHPEMNEFRKIEKEPWYQFKIWEQPDGIRWGWFEEYFKAKYNKREVLVDYKGKTYSKWLGMYDGLLDLEIVIIYPHTKGRKRGDDIEVLVQFNGKVDEDETIPWKDGKSGLFVEHIYPLLMSWMSGEF